MNQSFEESGLSLMYYKEDIIQYINHNFKYNDLILDMGAGQGIYKDLLPEYKNIEAVELWQPSIDKIKYKYKKIYIQDIKYFEYLYNYDLILFFDIIEHFSIKDAQSILEKAKIFGKTILVGVPFKMSHDVIDGNQLEIHIQNDLTNDIFLQRFKNFKPLFIYKDYGYYISE